MTLRSLKRRVAFLMDAVEDDYQVGILRGVSQAAEPTNVQLVCIAGGVVGNAEADTRSQRNFLFDLIDPREFSGILTLSGALSNQIGVAGFADFLRRFAGLPIVNLGIEVPAQHSISVDGAAGMRAVVSHLIKVHDHRRIAFIRGPVASLEAEQRYAAYCAALSENGIALDSRLVLQGSWLRESGALAVRELLGDRGVRVESIGAIAAANDYMALGALDALAERRSRRYRFRRLGHHALRRPASDHRASAHGSARPRGPAPPGFPVEWHGRAADERARRAPRRTALVRLRQARNAVTRTPGEPPRA